MTHSRIRFLIAQRTAFIMYKKVKTNKEQKNMGNTIVEAGGETKGGGGAVKLHPPHTHTQTEI
jgi:hypothetical protein